MLPNEDRKIIFDSTWRLDEDGLKDWKENTDYVSEYSDYEQQMAYDEYIWSLIGDEQANLDIEIDGTILAYGSASLWNGVSRGADPMGTNINSIFDIQYEEDVCFYVEDDDVWAHCPGHDGSTEYCFRIASAEYIEKLDEGEPIGGFDAFRENTASLAPYVADVYGW